MNHLAFSATVCAFALTSTQPANSQVGATPPTVASSSSVPASVPVFDSLLQSIAARGKFAVLIEAAPVKGPEDKQQAATAADKPDPDAALRAFADLYDYDVSTVPSVTAKVSRGPGAVYLLRKRYTTIGDDLPSLTIDECRRSAEALYTLVSSQAPNPPVLNQVGLVQGIYKGFSPEQRKEANESGVRVADLPSDLQAQVWRMATHVYAGHVASDFEKAKLHLTSLDKTEVYPRGTAEQPGFGMFFHWHVRSGTPGDGNYYTPFRFLVGEERDDNTSTQSTENVPVAAPPSSLGFIVDGLNKTAKGTPASPRFAVEPGLAAKTATLFRGGSAEPTAIFRGLSLLYGLRDKTGNTSGERLLTYVIAPPVKNAGDLPFAVRTLLPEPLVRMLKEDEDRQLLVQQKALADKLDALKALRQSGTSNKAEIGPQIDETFKKYLSIDPRRDLLSKRPMQLVRMALSELHHGVTRVGQTLPASERYPTFPFNQLPERTQLDFIVWVFHPMLASLSAEMGPRVPSYIKNFSDCVVTARTYEQNGKQLMYITLGSPSNRRDGAEGDIAISDIEAPKY